MNFVTYEVNGKKQLGALLPDGEQIVSLAALGLEDEYRDMVDFIRSVSDAELMVAEKKWKEPPCGPPFPKR